MKHFLLAAFLLFAIGNASAQIPLKWTRLHGPNVGSSTNVLWGAKNEIICPNLSVSNSVEYSYSTDYGAHWDSRTIIPTTNYSGNFTPNYLITSTGDYYLYLYFNYTPIDSSVIGIYRSNDFGLSWQHILPQIHVKKIIEGGDQSLIIQTSNDTVLKSIDQGKSWVQLSNNAIPSGASIIAAGKKYLFSYYAPYYGKEIDKYSFETQKRETFIPGFEQNKIPKGFVMIDDTHLIGYSDTAMYITDGDQSWTMFFQARQIRTMMKGNGNLILAQIFSGSDSTYQIILSNDTGNTWNKIGIASGKLFLTDFSHPDHLLNEDQNALRLSTDNGTSWKEIGFPFASIGKVLISEDGTIFASYNSGIVTISTDKGDTWQSSYQYQVGYGITYIGHGIGTNIIGITNDKIMLYNPALLYPWLEKSLLEFTTVWGNSSTPFIASDNSKYIYIGGGRIIYRSDDTAFSWLDLNAPNTGTDISCIEVTSDGTIYFGCEPIMYRSDDNGTTWMKLVPIKEITKLTCIKARGSEVLVGTQGLGLYRSNDKGDSWSRIDGNNFDTVTCIAINSKGEVAAGTNRGLWTSDATKMNWTKITLGSDADLYIGGIDVAANDDFYVGTYGSSVWMGTTNYNSAYKNATGEFTMNISPNPSQSTIKISFNIPSEAEAKLELYDILGRRISVIAGGKYSGENEISYSTANLPSGIYSLVLVAAGKNESQKLVVNR